MRTTAEQRAILSRHTNQPCPSQMRDLLDDFADLETQLAEARELLIAAIPKSYLENYPDVLDWWKSRRDAWIARNK